MKNPWLIAGATILSMVPPLFGETLVIDATSHRRDLAHWKPVIRAISRRHYHEDTWVLHPTCIVLHYTVTSGFPNNLVTDPELTVHYVVDGAKVWQILPPNVRSAGAHGINHRAINIEMVAKNANDLKGKRQTLKTCAALVRMLMRQYGINLGKVYSHQDVGTMDTDRVPEALDYVDSAPYGNIDPGEGNMRTIKAMIRQLDGDDS